MNHPFTLGSGGGERFEKSAAEGKGAEEPEGVVRAVEFVEFRFVGAFPREYRSGENCILRGTMSSGASSPRLETIMNSSPPSLSGP